MLRRVPVSFRLFSLVGLVVLFSAASFVGAAFIAIPLEKTVVRHTQQTMLEGEKGKIKAAAHAMAVALEQALQPVATEAERKALVRRFIDPIRFEDDASGYFFVNQATTPVALPTRPELVGQDLNDFADPNGVHYVRELYRRAHGGGGFVAYIFPKPHGPETNKLSYAEMIPGTDFYIGTGVYIDNVQREEARIAGEIRGHFARAATVFAVLFTAMMAALCALCLAIGYSIARPLAEATKAAESIASGDFEIRLTANGNDEATRLHAALNRMTLILRQNISEIESRRAEAEEKSALAQQALLEAHRAGQEVVAQVALRLESLQKISAAVAHQLRNPTTIIGGLAGLLIKKNSTPRQDYLEYLDGIIGAAKRIERIATSVNEYSSIHLDKLETTRAGTFLDAGREAGEQAARRLGTPVRWEIDGGDVAMLADRKLLAMALREIVTNAVESLPGEGGTIRLTAATDGETASIAVTDNGKGIPAEECQFLLDPFYTTKSIGVGMGLTKALRALQEHRGTLSIASEPGRGTTVTLSVPTRHIRPATPAA